MTVKGSENYVWFANLQLGNGPNGPSYTSRNKKTGGTFVAKELTCSINNDSFKDKFLKIKHENLVALYGLEEETKSSKNVLILEFCDERSLQDILLSPENCYGLDENNMFSLYNGLFKGLTFLNEEKLLLTSFYLKSTTVLCSKDDDNSLTFKISDYYFVNSSNDMYYAMAAKSQLKNISPLSWSLGCLLSHAIIGKSPFNDISSDHVSTLNLLKHRKTDDLYMAKAENGSYEWKNSFPITCQISQPVQLIFHQYINNFLKVGHTLSFKDFSKSEFSKVKVELFNVNDYQLTTHFLDHSTVTDLKLKGKLDKNVVLVHRRSILEDSDVLNLSDGVSMNEPIVVISKDQNIRMPNLLMSELKNLHSTLIHLTRSNDDDMSRNIELARRYSSFAYVCLRLHSSLIKRKEMISKTMQAFKSLALEKYNLLQHKFSLADKRRKHMNVGSQISAKFSEFDARLKAIKKEILALTSVVPPYPDIGDIGLKNDCELMHCNGQIKENVQQAKTTFNKFLDQKNKLLSHNDKQILKYDRIKVNECAHKSFKLIYEHCINYAESVQKIFMKWFINSYNNYFGKQTLFDEMENKLKSLNMQLNSIKEDSGFISQSNSDSYQSELYQSHLVIEVLSYALDERSKLIEDILKSLEAKPSVEDIYNNLK